MTDLTPLIKRIEEAEEGGLELTRAVHEAAKGTEPWFVYTECHYTTSIDAIVGLIESEFPGCGWAVNEEKSGAWAKLQPFQQGPLFQSATLSNQPALALCAAFLKAVQARRAPHP